MFQEPDLMDIDMSIQFDEYALGADMFDSQRLSGASFRTQQLGTYLLSDLFNAEYMDESYFVRKRRLVTFCQNKEHFYTGEQFDQWDLDVLLHCVMHAPMHNGRPNHYQITPADMLHYLNMRNSQSNRDHLFTSLQRLHSGVINIQGKGYQYMTKLLDRVLVDGRRELCLVQVNDDVAATFREGGLANAAHVRLPLGNDGLAKWLHGAMVVFAGGFASDIKSLYALCRSRTKQKHHFINRLEKALNLLKEHGALECWELTSETLRVSTHASLKHGNMSCGLFPPASAGSL